MLLERLKALADETRLRIYGVLLRHELNVNEIVAVLGMGQSRVSRHLKILTDCGLLKCRKDGLWSFYSADTSLAGADWPGFIEKAGYPEPTGPGETSRVYARRAEDTARFFDDVAENWER
jgi:ArsR family transcriptional regulator